MSVIRCPRKKILRSKKQFRKPWIMQDTLLSLNIGLLETDILLYSVQIELFQPHTTFSFQGVGKPAPSPFSRERELLGGFPEPTSRHSARQRGRFFAKSILCRHSASSRIPHFEQFTFSPFRYTMMPGSKSLSPHELAHRWVKDLLTRPPIGA